MTGFLSVRMSMKNLTVKHTTRRSVIHAKQRRDLKIVDRKQSQHGTGEITVSDNNLDGGAVLFIFVIGIFVGMTIASTAAYFGVFSACGG